MSKVLVVGGSGFIGSHLVAQLLSLNYEVINLDIKSPVDGKNMHTWQNISILDFNSLSRAVLHFTPDYIVNLSATTTQNANSLSEFSVNIQGTKNLVEIVNKLSSLRKFVLTSSQYVNSPGYEFSENRENLHPYGYYGESKLIGEDILIKQSLKSNWTIIRPTTIWGPWHPILTDGLWKQILCRRYFHPRGDEAIKAYGYVKNTAWQIVRLLEIENTYTDKKVFYIGDENIHQDKWVSAFVNRLTNQRMKRIPKSFLLVISEIGEILIKLGIKFPLYRSRYQNLLTSNPSPLEETLLLLGPSPISLEMAVDETCTWLEQINKTSKRID